MKSAKYKTVRSYYLNKLWSERQVRDAVAKNWITEEEFEEIVGKPYNNDQDGDA